MAYEPPPWDDDDLPEFDNAEEAPVATMAARGTTLKGSALAYAEQDGLCVFPLKPREKVPLTANGLDDATADAMTVETWWARWPDANVAIRTGDVLVIDEDREHALQELAAQQGQTIPPTRIASTGKGRHYYFLQPDDFRVRNSASKIAQGIDTRGDGGYVVAPPSVHPNGSAYVWESDAAIAPLPFWLANLLRPTSEPERRPLIAAAASGDTTPYGQRALEMEAQAVATAPEGTRNDRLNIAAFALGQLVAGGEISERDAQHALQDAASACGLADREAALTIRSGFTSGLNDPRRAPERPGVPVPPGNAVVMDDVTKIATSQPEVESQHTWMPIDLVSAALAPPEPPTIGGIAYPGRRHLFSGEPESLKSWGTFCLTVEEIRKGNCVLHLDLEMGRADVYERLTQLGLTQDEIQQQFIYMEPSEAITADGVLPFVTQLIEERKPSLVIIDAFTGALAIHGYSPNADVEIEAFHMHVVEVLRKHGAAVVILDHLPKDKENRGMYSIGSGRKVGVTDVHLSFSIIQPFGRGKTGRSRLTTKKDRPGHLPRPKAAILELESHPITGQINYTWNAVEEEAQRTAEWAPTTLMEKISRYMEKHPEGASRSQIEIEVKGSTKHRKMAIEHLVREGYLEEVEGLRGARIAHHRKPYVAPSEGHPFDPDATPTPPRRVGVETPAPTVGVSTYPPNRVGVELGNKAGLTPTPTRPTKADTALDAHHDSLFDPTGDDEFDFDNVDF